MAQGQNQLKRAVLCGISEIFFSEWLDKEIEVSRGEFYAVVFPSWASSLAGDWEIRCRALVAPIPLEAPLEDAFWGVKLRARHGKAANPPFDPSLFY